MDLREMESDKGRFKKKSSKKSGVLPNLPRAPRFGVDRHDQFDQCRQFDQFDMINMIDIDIQISISERSSGWATNYKMNNITCTVL